MWYEIDENRDRGSKRIMKDPVGQTKGFTLDLEHSSQSRIDGREDRADMRYSWEGLSVLRKRVAHTGLGPWRRKKADLEDI